jgi:hypothetical protein
VLRQVHVIRREIDSADRVANKIADKNAAQVPDDFLMIRIRSWSYVEFPFDELIAWASLG